MPKYFSKPLTWLVAAFLLASPLLAKLRQPDPSQRQETYSLSEGAVVPIPAKEAHLPFPIFAESSNQELKYVASGYMGDMDALKIKVSTESVLMAPGINGDKSIKVMYTGRGRQGWVGLYWLTPANNWGRIKGAGFNLEKAERLTFWIRGEKGGEKVAEIKMGGIVGPYPDTDVASIGPLQLKNTWEQYTVDLKGKDLRHIVGGFAFILRRADAPVGETFYMDEIKFEGPAASSGTAHQ